MTTKHHKTCIDAHENWEDQVSQYKHDYPNYCKSCNGWGGNYSRYDPSPSGISLGSGYMLDYEPCEDCVEKGICPRCGKVSDNIITALSDGDCGVCEHCGWSMEETHVDGIPDEPECYCDYYEEEKWEFELERRRWWH